MSDSQEMQIVGGKTLPPQRIRDFHLAKIRGIGLPDWIVKMKCSKCGEELGELSIRGIEIKINAARIGDIAIGVGCVHCCSGYEMYYRNAYKTLNDAFQFFMSKNEPSVPVSSMDIKPEDSNLLDEMLGLDKNREKQIQEEV